LLLSCGGNWCKALSDFSVDLTPEIDKASSDGLEVRPRFVLGFFRKSDTPCPDPELRSESSSNLARTEVSPSPDDVDLPLSIELNNKGACTSLSSSLVSS
jgi:hypothetical protein